MMNGPSARALREGGMGGSIAYKIGFGLIVKPKDGGSIPVEWKRKTTLQGPFGEFGQIIRIDVQESSGCAYVEYEDARDAEDAEKDLNGKSIAGKVVTVTMCKSQDSYRRSGSSMATVPGSVDIEARIAELAMRHALDDAACSRLSSVFQDRSRLGCDLNRDFQDLSEHLAASNKPSALVSMKLAELRSGRTIGPCKYNGARRQIGDAIPADYQDDRRDSGRGRDRGYRERGDRDRGDRDHRSDRDRGDRDGDRDRSDRDNRVDRGRGDRDRSDRDRGDRDRGDRDRDRDRGDRSRERDRRDQDRQDRKRRSRSRRSKSRGSKKQR
eukprot:TRINITY_DN4408_c0_g1_i4.p1 TRINITY_DN4408_c0_g1~~TRINITY_DN4408_c0_g1_i4.p1  ORF type:complete len:326 (+),score=38.37 TRINITY_DN4408_c0_g1_i4:171-1148(+)